MRVCQRCRSIYPSGTRFCGIDGQELVSFVDDPLVGQRIGRYQVSALLGRGGCGSVYKAVHSELQTLFALKVLYGNLGGDGRYIERFRREAQAVSKIRSPWVVSVVDFGTSDTGLTYLVMEYCTGLPLDQIIATEKVVDPSRAARFTAQIASALAVAHKLGLVHRDVKPANVMIENHDGKEFAKLLDFGIVRLPELDASEKLTQEGAVMGTPPYMSPEQASGAEVTAQSDLYSLGVVLYQMLAGRKPFTGSASEIFRHHHHTPPPPLPMAGPIVDLCYELLAKDPASRPINAASVAERAKHIEVDMRGGEPSIDPDGLPAFSTPATGMPASKGNVPAMPTGMASFVQTQAASTPPPQPHPTQVASMPPVAPSAESLIDLSGAVKAAPSRRGLQVVFGLALVLSVIAVVLLLQEPPSPEATAVAPRASASATAAPAAETLEVQERALGELLTRRGLRMSDLATLQQTRMLYGTYQDQRAAAQPAARETLGRLIDEARRVPVSEELLKLHLDRLDAAVAGLADKLAPADFELTKTEYLDLYRQVQLATTDAEREVMAQAITRFDAKLAERSRK